MRSKSVGHNTYTCTKIDLRSKPTPIHGPVHTSDFNYLYSRSHLSRLPQAVAKTLSYRMYLKVSNASKVIDPVINGFSPHDE